MRQQDSETLRATAVIALFAIGAMHFLQIVDTLAATPLLGVAYLFLIAASVVLATRLLLSNDQRAWLGAGLLGAAVMVGYAFTRLVGTTFDPEDVGNWACALGLASLFVEGSLVGISAYALTRRHATAAAEAVMSSR